MDTTKLHRRFKWFLIAWAVLLVAFFVYLNVTTDFGKDEPEWDSSFPGWLNLLHPYYWGLFYATFIIVPVVLYHRHVARLYGGFSSYVGKAIWLLSIGGVAWGLGNAYWFYANVTGIDVPYPSFADLGYVSILPFAAAALFYLTKVLAVRTRDLAAAWWILLPVLLFTGYWVLPEVSWLSFGDFTYGKSALYADDYDFFESFVASLYVSVDVVLLSLSVFLLLKARQASGGLYFKPLLSVVASMVMLYVADLFFFSRVANETYYAADPSEGMYGAFMFLLSWAVYNFLGAEMRSQAAMEAMFAEFAEPAADPPDPGGGGAAHEASTDAEGGA